MKPKSFALGGAAASLLVAITVSADFTGLSLEEFTGEGWLDNGYGMTGLITRRLYANFDGAGDDGILSVAGRNGFPMRVESSDGVFHNDLMFGGLLAPLDLRPVGTWSNQWDTYVTINATTTEWQGNPQATSTSDPFSAETNGLRTNWSTENAGWFVTPDDDQSGAIDNQVLLAQFVVSSAADATVSGTVNILTREGQRIDGLAFAHPAPGALALLGLAGLSGPRRRR